MPSFLSGYYFSPLDVAAIVLLLGGAAGAIYWALWRRARNEIATLQQDLARRAAGYDGQQLQALHNHLQSVVAHEFVRSLDYISQKSTETLAALPQDQHALRDKQERIVVTSYETGQRATNVLFVFGAQRSNLQKELLRPRHLIEDVLRRLYPYAEGKGVTLMPRLDDVEPAVLNRNLTCLAVENLVHNAIKYSARGSVVTVSLVLSPAVPGSAPTWIYVDVQDTGKGIAEQDQESIFALHTRADGLVEPGNGLGLYCAREAARVQGGDLVLLESRPNQGSTFRAVLPYTGVVP